MPNDLTSLVPNKITVIFPGSGIGCPASQSYAVDVTLVSLGLAQFNNIPGAPWTKLFHRYERALYNGGTTPTNAATLTALAKQFAKDWYLWQLASLDQYYTGAADFIQEGFHDYEWRQGNGRMTTHVHRRSFNLAEDLLIFCPDQQQLRVADGVLVDGVYDANILVRDNPNKAWTVAQKVWGIDLSGSTSLTASADYTCHFNGFEPRGPYYVAISTTTGDALTDTSKWIKVVGSISPTAWSGATAYVIGNLVSSGGNTYICIADNTNNVPPNGTYWVQVTLSNQGGYNSTTGYAIGDYVKEVRAIEAFESSVPSMGTESIIRPLDTKASNGYFPGYIQSRDNSTKGWSDTATLIWIKMLGVVDPIHTVAIDVTNDQTLVLGEQYVGFPIGTENGGAWYTAGSTTGDDPTLGGTWGVLLGDPTAIPAWNAWTNYANRQLVTDSGVTYTSLVDNNNGNLTSDATKWGAITPPALNSMGVWNAGTTYSAGDWVTMARPVYVIMPDTDDNVSGYINNHFQHIKGEKVFRDVITQHPDFEEGTPWNGQLSLRAASGSQIIRRYTIDSLTVFCGGASLTHGVPVEGIQNLTVGIPGIILETYGSNTGVTGPPYACGYLEIIPPVQPTGAGGSGTVCYLGAVPTTAAALLANPPCYAIAAIGDGAGGYLGPYVGLWGTALYGATISGGIVTGLGAQPTSADISDFTTAVNALITAGTPSYPLANNLGGSGADLSGTGPGTVIQATLGANLTVVQYSTTGSVAGFTAGASTTVTVDSTFAGTTGGTAYTIDDLVDILKAIKAAAP